MKQIRVSRRVLASAAAIAALVLVGTFATAPLQPAAEAAAGGVKGKPTKTTSTTTSPTTSTTSTTSSSTTSTTTEPTTSTTSTTTEPTTTTTTTPPPAPRHHYIANLQGSTAPAALGYNVFDTSPSGLANLPPGVQGLIWLGQKCPTPADAAFTSSIDTLSQDPRVFGYYLSDEPHIADCPDGPAALKTRTDYIHSKTTTQLAFIVLSKQVDFGPFAPSVTGVDAVGMDPYPCSTASPDCPVSKITTRVNDAIAAGIPASVLVPTFQAFGQENIVGGYYLLPTPDQERAMLAEWHRLLPAPLFDYTYSWGNQSSSNPTLVDSPDLQAVFQSDFA